ncbi:NUDIX hydrolase [Streptomyces lydicus]|uniref:NUDIX hydrolase n=1 Tax=Streptomyces lydicus TaxID=47763 RepID=UPI0037199525
MTTRPEIATAQTELQPLARTIARTLQATPLNLGSPEGIADLTAALTVAIAAYMGRELGPAPGVLGEIVAERARQDARWGVQNRPNGTGTARQQVAAGVARARCQAAAERGEVTWHLISAEEHAEAMAESDPAKLRTELIQDIAVKVAWVQAIDRRETSQ